MKASDLIAAARGSELPALYTTDGQGDAAIVRAKFFTPWTQWTWFAVEFDGADECFGLVDGLEVELGSFSLRELESIRGPGGLRIEHDQHFAARPLADVRKAIAERGDLSRGRVVSQ